MDMASLELIGFSFSLGALTFLNPCSFALLPAFISFIMGKETREDGKSRLKAALHGVKDGFSATLGFATVFLAIGGLVSWMGAQVRTFVPPTLPIIGVFLVILGFFWTLNRPVLSLSKHGIEIDLPRSSFYLFGIAYALSSLACAFPLFLMAIHSSLLTGGFLSTLAVFLSFTFGMGLLMISTTVSIALSKSMLVEKLEDMKKYVNRISGVVMVLAGIYLIYYWTATYFL